MATLQTESNCQTNDPNNSFTMEVESSLRFPLDGSMRIVFTGYYNGFGVEIRSPDEVSLLYHMGCFGKGSVSRSKPKTGHNEESPAIMRKRQFLKRNLWFKKYGVFKQIDSDSFIKDVDMLASKIINDGKKYLAKDVIDLVSSDENSIEVPDESEVFSPSDSFHNSDKQDIVVIVPNSDSENDDYFVNLKPKCCINKIKLQEKLMLTKQEAFFLLYGLGCLQIINVTNDVLSADQCWQMFAESEIYFIEKYIVYHYFRSKGYIVKPGIKFGVLYKEGPEINHADYIVLIRYSGEKYDWLTLLGHIRVASTTIKDILMAEVVKPDKELLKLPQDLSDYSVQELILTRNIPVAINEDTD